MRNIFIEGIQGQGKTTLLNRIATAVPDLKVCREGDYSPIDLAWCAWLTEDEYFMVLNKYDEIRTELLQNTVQEANHYIITYTRIITDIPNFHKTMEKYEIYNGNIPLQDFKNIIIARFNHFSQMGYLFECSFFQNIIEELILFYEWGDDKIVAFYQELYKKIKEEDFLLLYLDSDILEENIRLIKRERCDDRGNEVWYLLMQKYLNNSPYGKRHNYSGFEDMLLHFKHRQQLERRIITEIIGENAVILQAKNWTLEDFLDKIHENNELDFRVGSEK